MVEPIEQLTFRLTAAERAEQERTLATLRSCAGTVLAASSIAGSFFAAGSRHRELGVFGVLAMATFALCSGVAVWVLLPHTFVFAFRGDALLASRDADPGANPDLAEAYRAAAGWIEPHLHANRTRIAMLAEWTTLSCVLLVAEVILWTVGSVG
jgi:hypothetical protein